MIMKKNQVEIVRGLFTEQYGKIPDTCTPLPPSGSYRRYYRLKGKNSCIAVYNEDIKENEAFISFTGSFLKQGIPVAKIIHVSDDRKTYLLDDLGEKTVYDFLKEKHSDQEIIRLYEKIIGYLLKIQFEVHKVIDYSKCYPRSVFDAQSLQWDLNYFKYNFLKFIQIAFNEQLLENDFQKMIAMAGGLSSEHFLYRDFQSSNIVVNQVDVAFVDYQGGRKGSFYYDLASLLYDAKANLSEENRVRLKKYYFNALQKYEKIGSSEFDEGFTLMVLIRIMQAMGAYGFRGLYEKKAQFVKSIPLAVKNLKSFIEGNVTVKKFPELMNVFNQIINKATIEGFNEEKISERLLVRVNSFSYRRSIPIDYTGNGGGFVFDCRGLPNPGRYEAYKTLTGKDIEVVDFFRDKEAVHDYLHHIYSIIDITVDDYLKRKRTNLQVNFGCTGGQHRSVYCAENLARYLQKYDLDVEIKHFEQDGV